MAVVLIFCIALLSTPLAATTVQRFSLAGLTANAERIVVGTCSKSEPRLIHGQIYTRYLFNVDTSIKGPAADQLELHLPGGHLQGVFTRIAGMPIFTPGDEVVLFLSAENSLGHAWPVGLTQGRFSILRHEPDQPLVTQTIDDISLYTNPNSAKRVPLDLPAQGMPLDRFLAKVRTITQDENRGPQDAH
tara:strand:+ start:311 stop:877 length:567 start_codon:yes stop_codon:yes gene_type:complete